MGVRCATIVGGMEMMDQARALAKRPHVVVATPGRLNDHLENTKGFSLRSLKFLVCLVIVFVVLNTVYHSLPGPGRSGSTVGHGLRTRY